MGPGTERVAGWGEALPLFNPHCTDLISTHRALRTLLREGAYKKKKIKAKYKL